MDVTTETTETTENGEQKKMSAIANLAARVMVVNVSLSAWRPTRLHKSETAAERQRHQTDAVRVSVRLTDHPALEALSKTHAAAYAAHRRLTLAGAMDGLRLLPAGRQTEHAAEMSAYKAEHQRLAAQFVSDYENEAASAPQRLNGLFDPRMWPQKSEVERRFSFSCRYLPCPTDGAWGEWLETTVEVAKAEFAQRIAEAAQTLLDEIKTGKRIYQSVVDTIRWLSSCVDYNIDGDVKISSALGALSQIPGDAEILRASPAARAGAEEAIGKALQVL